MQALPWLWKRRKKKTCRSAFRSCMCHNFFQINMILQIILQLLLTVYKTYVFVLFKEFECVCFETFLKKNHWSITKAWKYILHYVANCFVPLSQHFCKRLHPLPFWLTNDLLSVRSGALLLLPCSVKQFHTGGCDICCKVNHEQNETSPFSKLIK